MSCSIERRIGSSLVLSSLSSRESPLEKVGDILYHFRVNRVSKIGDSLQIHFVASLGQHSSSISCVLWYDNFIFRTPREQNRRALGGRGERQVFCELRQGKIARKSKDACKAVRLTNAGIQSAGTALREASHNDPSLRDSTFYFQSQSCDRAAPWSLQYHGTVRQHDWRCHADHTTRASLHLGYTSLP